MHCQPPSRRQRRALTGALPFTTFITSLCTAMLAVWLWSSDLAQAEFVEKLTASTARRLLGDNSTVPLVYNVTTADDLYNFIAEAKESDWVVLNLPPGSLVLNTTLKIPVSASLHGVPVTENGPGSVLRCGADTLTSLIEFNGSRLILSGIQLQDCNCAGLRLTSTVDADVTIQDSVFQNFTRVLDSGRINGSQPGVPASIERSTAALAVHAGSFSGNLTVRNSRFLDNAFSAGSQRRRLYDHWVHGGGGRGQTSHVPRKQQRASTAAALGDWVRAERRRRLLAALQQSSDGLAFTMSPWAALTPESGAGVAERGRRLADTDGAQDQYSMPLLENARMKHPGLQDGPWADDLETVFAVVCREQRDCSVTIEDTTFDGNTGVATGALYVLCDGAASCDVDLTNTFVTNNKLLWQQALQEAAAAAAAAETAGGTGFSWAYAVLDTTESTDAPKTASVEAMDAEADAAQSSTAAQPNGASPEPAAGPEPADADAPQPSPPSQENATDTSDVPDGPWWGPSAEVQRLWGMAPWLTYTFPLLNYFLEEGASEGSDSTKYPAVTGRTLGAVVLHQRRSPSSGVRPSAARSMMRMRVTGGRFSGNDGAAMMSTATDFMDLAGGNGTWFRGPPRHSADVYLSGLQVENHHSGWPAIWLRWARKVEVKNCTMTNSTAAVWLDEVRDSALLQNSTFKGNTLADPWLDYMSFASSSLNRKSAHVVKIQMTPLGEVQNTATVRGCTFEDNPAYATGVLYIRASDEPDIDVEDQPGRTHVEVQNTTFFGSRCGRFEAGSGNCNHGARALRIASAYGATIEGCRFIGNLNGGLAFSSVRTITVTGSEFDGNQLTYDVDESPNGDNSVGGAGLYAEGVGSGGITITKTNFTRNTATIGGGAVYLRFFGPFHADDCRFDDNVAETFDGGAVWLQISTSGTTSITACNFTGNVAGRNGGAICARNLGSSDASSFGWGIYRSDFWNNEALRNPVVERGTSIIDQAGGGAVFASAAAFVSAASTFVGNTVRGHAGGALRVVDSIQVELEACTFSNNAAIMGGAVALSRMSRDSLVRDCEFHNNTVADPRGWEVSVSQFAPSVAFIDPGYGGAVYAFYSTMIFERAGVFVGNSAKFGGAIASMSSPRLFVQARDRNTYLKPLYTVPVAAEIAAAAGLDLPDGPALLYRFLFANNSALIGGALYLMDTESTKFDLSLMQYWIVDGRVVWGDDGQPMESPDSIRFKNQPATVFLNNTANGGGAVYLEGNGKVDLQLCRFAANKAVVPPLAANYSGLYGSEKENAMAKALPCYHGGGGGICIVGQTTRTLSLTNSDFIHNAAKDGAGIYVAEGLDCISQAGCYSVTLRNVNMTGNTAARRGGGVFWMHEGILSIDACPSDKARTFLTNGATAPSAGNNTMPAGFNVTLTTPVRKGPAGSYQRLTFANQDILLASIGGAVRAAKRPLLATNGDVVVRGEVVYALSAAEGTTRLTDGGLVAVEGAYLTPNGSLVSFNASDVVGRGDVPAPPVDWLPVASRPVVLNGSVLIDPAWYGVPYTNLPCANWDNAADTGPDLSSTPYFVVSPSRIDFYTSNTDIRINVTVHDWLGHNCTGDNETQPLVLVQAESKEVSGAVTVPAENGTASFTALRLRAREGLHRINMTGRSHQPVRELLASTVAIYVRPCALNEFLSPKNLDECIPCDPGSYNFNVSAVTCQACPDNANCLYPDPAACKLGSGCPPTGFLVPHDGYWHANFFSEEVLECTNPDACTALNRSSRLSQTQLTIWKVASQIQVDAATLVAESAAKEALAQLLAASLGPRLLQEKALSDDLEVLLILNATAGMLPDYMQNQCAEGYTGTLCGECEPGFGWRRIATCGKCPPRALNNLYYALVTLLTLSLLAFTVYSSLKEQRRPGLLVGGITAKPGDNPKPDAPTGKVAKINPAAHHLCVQASGPSQFHVILAAAAAEDAAAEAAPALALLREQRSRSPMTDHEFGGPFEYVDPVLAAARNQYGSAPGTPKGSRSVTSAPFPLFDTTARAHSVLGVPARASRWASLDDSRRGGAAPGSFGRDSTTTAAAAAAAVTAAAAAGTPAAGPVAEGLVSGYDNALYEDSAAVDGCRVLPNTENELMTEEVEVEEFTPTTRGFRQSKSGDGAGRQPVAESKDYTNALYEERAAAAAAAAVEIQSTDAQRSAQPILAIAPANSVNNPLHHTYTYEVGGGAAGASGDPALPHHPQMPPGVMLQSVPVMQSNSPPRTPLHGSITSAPPGALELATTVTERVRLGELPRRGTVVGRERAHQSTVVKIFVSYVQVLALLQNVPLDIPGVVDVYYRINNQAISYPGILVSLDCSLPHTGVSKAFVRVILTVLAPLYIFAGAVLFFLAYNVIDYFVLAPYYAKHPSKRSRKRHLQLPSFSMHLAVYLGRQLIVTFIAIFFFFYPSVVQSLMTIFNCQDVNVQTTNNPLANGLGLRTERIWSQDYGLKCYKGSHLALTLGLGVPGVLLIAIGWPLMSALFMTGKLTFMNNIRFTEEMTSFFLADFKAKFAWWESVIMLRKLFIAVIVTLVDGSTYAGVQLLLVICILVVASGIHLVAMPYHHMYTNNLELMSLGTLLATLYFSLYFGFSTSISDGGRVAISILILVINIVMVIIFVYYIIQAYFYAALLKTGLGDLDSEARRKLTAAELQQRILENLTAQASTTSRTQDGAGQPQPPTGERQSYQRVASLYAHAMWYSMRVGSTTNKVLTRVKTLLRDQEEQHYLSREDSGADMSGVPVAGDIEGAPDDHEAARGSGIGRKRAFSGPGATSTGSLPERSSRVKPLASLKQPKDSKDGGGGATSPTQSQSTPGIAAGSVSPSSSFTGAPRTLGSSGSQHEHKAPAPQAAVEQVSPPAPPPVPLVEAAEAAEASPRSQPKVISRASSSSSLDHPSLPPFPAALDITPQGGATAATATAAAVAATPPPPLLQPSPSAAAAAPAVVASPRLQAMRSMSRLAHASGGHAERNGELLPPPPGFAARGGPKP